MKRRTFIRRTLGAALATLTAFYLPGRPWELLAEGPRASPFDSLAGFIYHSGALLVTALVDPRTEIPGPNAVATVVATSNLLGCGSGASGGVFPSAGRLGRRNPVEERSHDLSRNSFLLR